MHFPRILSSCCVILLLFTGYSCRNTSATKQVGEKVNIKYAEGFDITRYPDYIRVDLRDPWDTTRLLHRYLLVDKKKDLSQSLPDGTLIRTDRDSQTDFFQLDLGTPFPDSNGIGHTGSSSG